jgi:hypothetical protein
MKKLDELSKENVFKVPDGYFEELPGIIQARVAQPQSQPWFSPSFKLAMPVVAIIIALTVWLAYREGNSVEDQLNEIQTEQLIAYLEESDLSDVNNEEVSLSENELNDLEETVFSSMEPFDITVEDLSVEPNNF